MPTKEPNRPAPERSDHEKLVHHHHRAVVDAGQMPPNLRHVIRDTADPSTTSTLVGVRSKPLGRRFLAALDSVARHPLVNTALRFVAEVLLRN